MASSNPIPLSDDPLWYKDAIIYEFHVKAFFDADNDGIGDFQGAIHKLDYLQDLGVNTLWLLPFYPSPMRDDGYDISDYRGVHPAYGTVQDVREFVREAHERGMRVITELVINHTSDQHPWFQSARRAPRDSRKRDYYVWSQTAKQWADTRVIFTDSEKSNWAWDDVAQSYYWHRFFAHQPDLNFNNPQVVKAVIRTMRYWLDMGIDGLRLDAIPYLCERDGTTNENLPETHAVIRQMREVIDQHYGNRMLLAEANQWPEDVREYFGGGDECHMAYHFPLMPRMYVALAQEDRHPVIDILRQTPDIPENCQWAIFLRNHDELTLEMVTDRERDYMYRTYAVDPRMRLNIGIRRRLAPLLDNNRGKIELMTFLLLTLPGSPILYYGDEIGMGDNIFLGDRNGVRTPMQWSPDRNAGFSRADPQRLYLPPHMDAVFGYEAVNVEAQQRSPSSLLNAVKRLIAVRKRYAAFGRGNISFLEPGNRKILAYTREYRDEIILCVANLSHMPQAVELNLARFRGHVPVELTWRNAFPPIGELPYLLTLPPYGYFFFRLAQNVDVPHWHEEVLPRRELPVLVLIEGMRTLFAREDAASSAHRAMASRTREQFSRDVLAPYIESKRWYAAKGRPIQRVECTSEGEWRTAHGAWLLSTFDVEPAGGPTQCYFLPLAVAWSGENDDSIRTLGAWTLARVRQRAREGILYGAFGTPEFCRALVRAMGEHLELSLTGAKVRFISTSAFADLAAGVDEAEVRHPSLEQSNTAVYIGERLFLKAYRRIQSGTNPEFEMGRHLTEVVRAGNVVPVAGAVEIEFPDGRTGTLALLQKYVENQGDAWHATVDYLTRFIEEAREQPPATVHAAFTNQISRLGERIGALHRALALDCPDPAFRPEKASRVHLARWVSTAGAEADDTFARLTSTTQQLDAAAQPLLARLLALRPRLQACIAAAGAVEPAFALSRYHGDMHLGQVLIVGNDYLITDFEGEPTRTLQERREKHSPLKDVAAMLRSFNYAAFAALKDAVEDRPGDYAALLPLVAHWEAETTRAFLAGYRAATEDVGSVPADAMDFERLLRLFVAQKALYEIRYELEYRPAWLEIPLRGLADWLDSQGN
ncbi:MAG: maltose alpha-D-glucosyltransferase [Gammaproteobacteria bacterium]